MAKQTNISWTDHTFNPWIGCTKVSAECLYCYAETVARKPAIQTEWGKGKPRRPASADTWKEPIRWNEQAKRDGVRRKVFCASMADVFDPEAPEGSRTRLFKLIREDPTSMLDLRVQPQRGQPRHGELYRCSSVR